MIYKILKMYSVPLPFIIPFTVLAAFSSYMNEYNSYESRKKEVSSMELFEKKLGYLSIGIIAGITYPIILPIYAIKLLGDNKEIVK